MGLHHCIQLCTGSAPAAAAEPREDGRMSTQLYLAVCEGRHDQAMALLPPAAGQVADQVSTERNNVLHLAAEQGDAELIQGLYDRFGDVRSLVSSQNSAMDTPLHCAARAGDDRSVSLLVQLARGCGAETILSCKNKAGDTALHLAARLGHAKAVEALVDAAPEVASEVNDAGVSPLYLAVMSRSEAAVGAITGSCVHASAAGPSSQNALHAAVFQGSRMVGLLLDWKPSLASEPDGSGSTPLHFASSDGDRAVVGAILRAAPHTARTRDSGGLSALHVAAGMGHARVTKALIEACPDSAELLDDRGGTFVHAAARGGHSKVVSLAIATKRPTLRRLLNTQDGDGNTPLHLAVAAGAPDIVEALMREGKARADVMNNDGQTPLDLAARSTSFFTMLGLVVTLAAFGAQPRPQRRDSVEKWSGRDIGKGIERTSDSLAVVAVLITTVAFTAANNVPGAYDQNDGMAVLQTRIIFKCFLVLDSLALVTSVIAVVLLVFGKASRSAGSWETFAMALHCIWVALISMILAFYAALAGVTNTRAVYGVAYNVIYVGFVVLYIMVNYMISPPVSIRTVWKVLWRTVLQGKHSVIGRRIKQQYPVAGAYAPNLLLFWATYLLAILAFAAVSSLSQQAPSH
uniref:Uncharacterized protein n=1 Tax=Avena sativa TaxID=4498 RepID=A0ACD5WA92_AVESA